MSSNKLVLVASVIWVSSLFGSAGAARDSATEKPVILERGPNHRIVRHISWQTNATGRVSVRTNTYTELATGLHYLENGEWKETKEEIEILLNGAGAVARQGGHKVIFAPNLNTEGAIDMETPDGKRLRSNVLGLGYYDHATGRSEIIAQVKSSEGELHGNNQVIYPDAFAGLSADVRFTYRKSGFEQDVILRSQPPAPKKFGMDPKTTRLEVFTEFLNAPTPVKTVSPVAGTSLTDEKLTFGRMSLGRGRAFPLGRSESRRPGVSTGKSWINVEGRQILIEEVEYQSVEKDLKALPVPLKTAEFKSKITNGLLVDGRKIPGKLVAAKTKTPKPMRLAGAPRSEVGFVLDYIAVQEWTEDDAVFESGQTYFISSGYWPYTLTIQAGAVIKFADDPDYGGWGHTLGAGTGITCPSNGFATLTSMHDDTVGETIEDSTGQPDLDVGAIFLELGYGPARIHNLLFKHAVAGMIIGSDTDNWIRNCQFVDCQAGVFGYGAVALTNVSFSDCGTLVDYSWLGAYNGTCEIKAAALQNTTGGEVLSFDPAADLSQVTFILHKCCLPTQASEINALGQAITTAGGTFSWTQCDPNDTDGDDMPDAWEMQQFGNLNQSGGDDYDGDGLSNQAEYNAGSDPNNISFSARFENLYVSNRTVTGICEVSGGVPHQMTVLVNSANLATATWSAYNSSFSFTLPDLDGDHNVLVALRGRVATNLPATDFTELTLDRVPPVVGIANPILASDTATVLKPYLQVQGYANEALSNYSYDLTNEFGLVTNQLVAVVEQFFDTNKFDFTTNYIQAFDVPLATNVNKLTLRVADLAGNVTVTNFDVVLDYTDATNAPVLALLWPLNDMQLSGDSFYIRGRINDETATLVAQQVDGSGVTNTVIGIVERNGMFWVENLPLSAGNNEWTIIATDAAGNVSSTNLTVIKSTVVVTVTSTPSGDDLYQPYGTVSGTVSDASYSVSVNGVNATVDESGNWTAENVPNYGLGTVTYDVTATPPEEGESGEGGSGGGDTGGGAGPVHTSVQKEQPPMVLITKAAMTLVETWDNSQRPDHKDVTTTTTYSAHWGEEAGHWRLRYTGTGSRIENGSTIGSSYWKRLTVAWSDIDPMGWGQETDSGDGDASGIFLYDLYGLKQVPYRSFDHEVVGWGEWFVYHFFAKDVKHEWVVRAAGVEDRKTVTVTGESAQTLFTGGKAKVARKNLFCLTAGATEYYNQPVAWPWFYTPNSPVPSSSITVGGAAVNADGKVYAVLPDNQPVDVTARVKGAEHYDAGVGAEKRCLPVKVTFEDHPDASMWPWQFELQLIAVCNHNWDTGNYEELASITWGLSIDANGQASIIPPQGNGAPGDCGKIVITTLTAKSDYEDPTTGRHLAGATMYAYFIGCCEGGEINFVQRVIADSHAAPNEVPRFDCRGGDVYCPFYFGPPGSSTNPNEIINNRTTVYPPDSEYPLHCP